MDKLTKVEAARRQLGAALSLHLAGQDPVSVHALVCAGCELAEGLVKKAGRPSLRSFTLAANPSMTDEQFTTIRNRYWNAFKHTTTHKGVERDDSKLFEDFSEAENEERLFVGWSDYSVSGAPMPVEASVYLVWFLALDFEKFAPDIDRQFLINLEREFPRLAAQPAARRKESLLRSIERFRKDRRGKSDRLIDYRPLMLGQL